MDSDRSLTVARWGVRIFLFLNAAFGIVFAIGCLALFPTGALLRAHLAARYGVGLDTHQAVAAMQALLAIGVTAAIAGVSIGRKLLTIIDSVRLGRPFSPENARRLTGIGWALLVWQVLDLLVGAIFGWMVHLGLRTGTWTPSIAGWLVVALVFVLARVFAHGAAMDDELKATI